MGVTGCCLYNSIKSRTLRVPPVYVEPKHSGGRPGHTQSGREQETTPEGFPTRAESVTATAFPAGPALEALTEEERQEYAKLVAKAYPPRSQSQPTTPGILVSDSTVHGRPFSPNSLDLSGPGYAPNQPRDPKKDLAAAKLHVLEDDLRAIREDLVALMVRLEPSRTTGLNDYSYDRPSRDSLDLPSYSHRSSNGNHMDDDSEDLREEEEWAYPTEADPLTAASTAELQQEVRQRRRVQFEDNRRPVFLPAEYQKQGLTMKELRGLVREYHPRYRLGNLRDSTTLVPIEILKREVPAVAEWMTRFDHEQFLERQKRAGVSLVRCPTCDRMVRPDHRCFRAPQPGLQTKKGIPVKTIKQVRVDQGKVHVQETIEPDIEVLKRRIQALKGRKEPPKGNPSPLTTTTTQAEKEDITMIGGAIPAAARDPRTAPEEGEVVHFVDQSPTMVHNDTRQDHRSRDDDPNPVEGALEALERYHAFMKQLTPQEADVPGIEQALTALSTAIEGPTD